MRCASLWVLAACGGSQLAEHHPADLTKVLPATLEASHAKQGEPRQVHLRVWADPAIRALPHWKEDVADQVDYASQLLTPLLGVRLVVDAIKDWDHVGGDVRDAQKALAAVDDGKDAMWVIGYIAPGDAATRTLSELADAPILGNHIVVRGWSDKPETDALALKLPDLKPAERAEVLAAHKRHKQTVVLLHALAESLGIIAEADPTWIGNPSYSQKQSTFSERSRELMQLAIDARLTGGNDQQIAHGLLENIEKSEWGGWVASSKDEVVKTLRNAVDAGKSGKTAADIPAAAFDQFDRIRELRKRDVKEALIELDNLLLAYPGNATMHELKCEIMLDKPGVADKTTRAACARVSELAPGDPSPHFAVGEALARTGDLPGARGELVQAANKINNLNLGQADAWRRLVGIYLGLGALTWTDEAIAAGKLDRDPAAAQVAQTRARYGVPRGAKFVTPAAEPALVAAAREALALIYANKFAQAAQAIAAGETKWRGAPGLEAARCDLALRQGSLDGARAACQRALAADPDESWALYLDGVIALKDASGTKLGIEQLKKAIAVDPELGQAWRALGKAYERAKDQPAHDELAKAYLAKFGQALP